MDEGVRTRLQARPAGAVRTLRVTVELGSDVGRGSDPDGASLVTVGSSPDNTLVLSDPLVSRYHLELRRAPDGIAIIDLGSTNGTWMAGVRLRDAVVPPGSRLTIGET